MHVFIFAILTTPVYKQLIYVINVDITCLLIITGIQFKEKKNVNSKLREKKSLQLLNNIQLCRKIEGINKTSKTIILLLMLVYEDQKND